MIDPAALAPESVRPLMRAEYERLVELGYFEDEKVELLAGTLVAMSPQGAAHSWAVMQLTKLLVRALGDRAMLRPQSSFALSDDSEPEPDLAVVPPSLDYRHEHPARALLLIEVAESSIRKDRKVKAALYARAGIPEYWIVDLPARLIEVRRAPRDGEYTQVTQHHPGDTVRPQAFDDIAIPVAEVVPHLR